MANDRLSSDNLYHFKSDVNVLQLILTHGFRHSMWKESIPYKKSEQWNFMVCFCDIRIENASYHRQIYGDNAIVLTKEWGKANGVSPVRYVHEKSPGILPNYIKSRNRFREIRGSVQDHFDTFIMHYGIFSVLLDLNKLKHDSLQADIAFNSNLVTEMNALESEFIDLLESVKTIGKDNILTKFYRSLGNRILELHNELENRDAFMRIYSDDFEHPASGKSIKGKILYDEKEWRSIMFATKEDYEESVRNKYLPSEYNLQFGDKDVLAILLKDEKTLNEVKDYLLSSETLLTPSETLSKLKVIDDYEE